MVAMTMTVLGAMLVMAAVQDGAPPALPSVETIMAKTREASGIQKRCVYDPNMTDITVCGRRNADRFRMPFEIPPEPGDPRHEGVMEERTRLLARSNSVRDMSPFLVGGGFTGVTMDTNPRGGGPTLRKPAP